ncbi:XRE family transcriptional regulator [Treponema sp. R80B11-R83G3]
MKYKSDILETIHESATEKFHIGAISEARMREYDELCLTPETSKNNNVHEPVTIEHADLVTA